MRVWIAAAIILGLAALGLAMLPRVIDWDAYRPDIEAAAIQLSGHDVIIAGPVEIALLPRPVLTARDVTVTGRTEDAIGFTLAASQAEVAMEIGPLLAGRPVVRDLRLRRPILTVDDDGSRQLRSWPPRWQNWAAPFLRLDFAAIAITDGKVELADDRPGRSLAISDISLQLRVDRPGGPLEAAGLFKMNNRHFTMTTEVGRPDREGLSAAKLSIEADNGADKKTTLRFNGRMTPFADEQALQGRLTLAGPDLQYALSAISTATGYPSSFRAIAAAQPFAVDGRIDADRNGVRAPDLQLRLFDKLGKGRLDLQLHPQTRLDLDVELPTLRLEDDAGLAGFLPLDLLSRLQVPPGEIDIRLREILYRDDAARRAGLKLKTGADGVTQIEMAKAALPGLLDLRFEGGLYAGEIGPRLKGHVSAVGDQLHSSLAWLDLADDKAPEDGWRGFSLESDVDVSSVEIGLSAIDLRLDSSRLRGKAGLRFSERHRLSLDVDMERPNLDLYGVAWDAQAAAEDLAARFKDLDADIDARFKRLIWQGVHVEEGSITASAEGGRLQLERIAAKTVGDTTLSLEGDVDLDGRAADLRAALTSQHPIRALRHLKLPVQQTSARLQPLELSGEISGTVERFELGLKADYDDGEATIEGEIGWIEERPWYDLTIGARHPDHLALASQIGLAPLIPAGDAEGPLELTGRLRHENAGPWIASGSAKLGPTSFTGSLAYETGALEGPFEAKLSVGSPQEDSLWPLLPLTGHRLAGDWTPARFLGRLPATGLRTAWLEKAEGSLSLVSKGGVVGDGLNVEARLGDGLLHVETLEASPWQGQLQAEVTLERRRDQPYAAIELDLSQVESARLADWLGIKRGISGPLDLRIEATSAGRTPYDLMAGLTGEVEIRLGPGNIEGLGVPALRRTLLLDGDSRTPAGRSLTLPFSEIDAKAALSRGILSFDGGRVVIDLAPDDRTEATLEGTADLVLWIVDLTLAGHAAADGEADDATDPAGIYRVVGPPYRLEGSRAAGN